MERWMAPAPPWRMSAGLNVGEDVIVCLFVESAGEYAWRESQA